VKVVNPETSSQKIGELPEPAARPGGPTPLEGLRVLDFTHFIAGPMATMILADGGAEVIKIEPPERGDDFRYYPPADPRAPRDGIPFLWTNRNKKSLVLDLKSPAGIEVAKELVKRSDVLVENFSGGVLERLGLGCEACRALNPRLIYATASAYGSRGEFADRGGFDAIVQAESGFMSMNGYADRDGVKTAATVMDMATAMMLSNAILMAVTARERLGHGQRVEASLFDVGLFMTGFVPMQYYFTGAQPARSGNTPPDTSPSGIFRCADQSFMLNSGNARIFERLVKDVLNCAELMENDAWKSIEYRITHRERLSDILNREFGRFEWAELQRRLRAAKVPHGELRTLPQALSSRESVARRRVTRIPHDALGWVPNFPLPIELSETALAAATASPAIGQHSMEVLRTLYADETIRSLARQGAFGEGGLPRLPAD
jgi:crotonobetainyl-CoA:carnitine CoA-transferase CaiB-like acyl-CoA transferase